MGKNNKAQNRRKPRSVFGGTYLVKGQRFSVEDANSVSIADDMARNGYRAGAVASWNGGKYRLAYDKTFGDYSLEKLA